MTDGGARPPALSRSSVRSALAYIDDWLAFRQHYLRIPGVQVAVLYDHEVLLSKAYGHADVEGGVALTPRHLFRVASHSKTFTATAVMQLVEAGLLRLDDPVGRWLSFLGESDSPVRALTIRDLLGHSGGLIRDGKDADYWQLLQEFPDRARLRAIALDDADVLPPTKQFKYSNIAYSLLGLVIEEVCGRPYNEQVAVEIVQRLGLTNTGPELDPRRSHEYATGYTSLAYNDARLPVEHVDTAAMSAATGFYSTAEDLCRYVSAHFVGDERLVSDQSKRVLQHAWWPIDGVEDGAYGLGFSVVHARERQLLGHGGGYPGHITRTVFDPEARLAVSVLTNAIDGPAEELALGIVKLLDLASQGSATTPEGSRQGRFSARLANLWGARDIVVLGSRLFIVDPTAADPTLQAVELEVEGEQTLRVVGGPGYGAVGEPVEYVFGPGADIECVKGPGGVTSWPRDSFRLEGPVVRAPG